MKAGIKGISELTGYSLATVSNALNHKRGVNYDTSVRILKAAQELGYVNSTKISKIRFVTYKKNGMILEGTPFFPALIDGVEREAKEEGYETVFCTLDRESVGYEDQLTSILNDPTAGMLLLGTEMMEEDFEPYQNAKCPLVLLDGWCDFHPFDSVLISNADSAAQAVEYLIANGHRRIGYLKGKFRIKNFCYRSAGFYQAIHKNGLTVMSYDIVPLFSTMEGAYQDMKGWLKTAKSLPTAFFADNDVIALGAMRAIKEYGLRIPEDVSIIGFDDLLLGEVCTPRLSTIHVFKQEMGQFAVRRLVDQIKKGTQTRAKIQICTKLIERESVMNRNH